MADPTFTYRLGKVETLAQNIDNGHARQAVTLAEHEVKITEVQASVDRLAETVSKGIWALVLFAFTVAGSAVTLAITVAS